jgi:tRNA(Ile)-lysidine synthase
MMLPELNPAKPPSPVLWVGFSGGLDSTVLLHRLRNDPLYASYELKAIHIHHGLQSQADAWARHCRTVCDTWNLALCTVNVQIIDRSRNIEQQARDARYTAFSELLADNETLVLAHHADDVAETLLLRLMRGSGTNALANMLAQVKRQHYWIWRPLLKSSRAELLAYAERHQLTWIEDDSNIDQGFDRNFIRHEILPRLQTRFDNVLSRLSLSAELLQADAELLVPLIENHYERCRTPDGLSLQALTALPITLQAHVLRYWLTHSGHASPGNAALTEFLQQLGHHENDADTRFDCSSYSLRVWQSTLYLLNPSREMVYGDYDHIWDGFAPLQLPRGGSLRWTDPPPFSVIVRYRQQGERIRLPGRDIRHSVKKLLSESLPPWQRDTLPFVYNEQNELLAVGDVLISDTLSRLSSATLNWQPPSE